jgi:hypothetical protein
MYKNITQDGYFKLADLDNEIGQSTTLNTVNAYMLASGIRTDLITPGLKTLSTLKKNI